jgi:hypothetical protein
MLKVTHNAGFFSCCSVRLDNIVAYYNKHRTVPEAVDSSEQFQLYKPTPDSGDITNAYFAEQPSQLNPEYTSKILFKQEYQFWNYKKIQFQKIRPFVELYFRPSTEILQLVQELRNSVPTNQPICVLFHRGNDKATETALCPYDAYIKKAKQVQRENPAVHFFLQSDETEFLETMTNAFPNSFYFGDRIRHIPKASTSVDLVFREGNFEASKQYLAITIFMASCAHIIFGSGNCSLWILLYRGNSNGVHQFLEGRWAV